MNLICEVEILKTQTKDFQFLEFYPEEATLKAFEIIKRSGKRVGTEVLIPTKCEKEFELPFETKKRKNAAKKNDDEAEAVRMVKKNKTDEDAIDLESDEAGEMKIGEQVEAKDSKET